MIDKLGLTFGTLIAHFIPSLILFLSVALYFSDLEKILPFIKEYSAVTIVVGSFISLACGLILDSIRYLLTWIPKLCKSYKKWSSYDISQSNEDDRKYHDWIIEHHFRFHQFYGNLSLSLLISAIVLNKLFLFKWLWPLYFFSAVCAISSIFTFYSTINNLKKRYSNTNKEETYGRPTEHKEGTN